MRRLEVAVFSGAVIGARGVRRHRVLAAHIVEHGDTANEFAAHMRGFPFGAVCACCRCRSRSTAQRTCSIS